MTYMAINLSKLVTACVLSLLCVLYVTGPAKTGHVGTNYTLSLYRTYLSIGTEYLHSVTCILKSITCLLRAVNCIDIA